MSETMRERIAKAIFDDLNDRRGIRQALDAIDEDIIDEIKETLANAILKAMREPTPEMLAAFVDGDDPAYAKDWRAMIDAAREH